VTATLPTTAYRLHSLRVRAAGPVVWMLFVLLIALPAFILVAITDDLTTELLLSYVIILYSGARLTFLAFRREHCYFQITFCLFVYCWLGLASAAQVASRYYPWAASRQSSANLIETNLIILLGIGAYELGLYFYRRKSAGRSPWLRLSFPTNIRYIALTALSLAASFYSILAQGGVGAVMVQRNELQSTAQPMTKGDGLIYSSLQHGPPLVALLVTISLLTSGFYTGRRKRLPQVLLIILIFYNLIANYPPALPRVTLGSAAVSIVFVLIASRPRLKPALVLGLTLALLILFPYLDYFRAAGGYTSYDLQHPREQLIHKPDYDAFQMLSNTVSVVSEQGTTGGSNLAGAFLFFVPRSLWASKAYGSGQAVGEIVGYRMLNLSSPLWAELYFAAGLVGVSIGFLLMGYSTGWIQRASQSPSSPMLSLVAYGAGFQVFMLRGDLQNSVAYSLPSIILILMFIVGGGHSSRHRPRFS